MAEEVIRRIQASSIEEAVTDALKKANLSLPRDIVSALEKAYQQETDDLPKKAMYYVLKNIEMAESCGLPVCQDTGLVTVIAKIGEDVHIEGGTINEAIKAGVSRAYSENPFRASVVDDPLFARKNTGDNTPPVVHCEFVKGDRLQLLCMPKGFGSENMSALKMFTPSATAEDIVSYIVDVVKEAGANPCPPILLGIGIGGTFDSVAQLAKEALFLPVDAHHEKQEYAALEERILAEVNATGIGPQGFGGKTTALSVHIKTAPTHVAGLPVAVCVSCYATRRVEITL